MLTSLRSSNQSSPTHQLVNLSFKEKVGKALQDATDQTTMLEAGSPTPLIAIFTVVVATNALACAAMMFVPHERAPLAETLIDVL
ncbi:hypothetical protein GQ600_15194 [Phytophthora cactorum]|nr:hypothetical protein GQ600_15194 [Phytophthora cactorum]